MREPWPDPIPEALEQEEIDYVVQVNGKTRATVKVPSSADKKTVETLAATGVQKYLMGKTIKRIIVVPGRLINVVV